MEKPPLPPRRINFDRLDWLRFMFKSACRAEGKLFNLTRLAINPSVAQEGDEASDWIDFKTDAEIIDTRAYDRGLTGLQHFAYHGRRNRLDEYTGLAAHAFMQMPGKYVLMSDSRRNAIFDRDAWTWAMYRFALEKPELMPIDQVGNNIYARTTAQEYHWIFPSIVNVKQDAEQRLSHIRDWQDGCLSKSIVIKYLYAALSLDVFTASYLFLDYILENSAQLYYLPEKEYLPGYRVYSDPFVRDATNAERVRALLKVDVDECLVTVGAMVIKVNKKQALFFRSLLEKEGGPISGSELTAIAMRIDGNSNFKRPDRIRADLTGLLSKIVTHPSDSNQQASFAINFDNVTDKELGLK